MHRRVLAFSALAAMLAFTACASRSAAGGQVDDRVPATSTSTVITAAELEQKMSPSTTALQAIQALRPTFLNFRGPIGFKATTGKLQVSVDGGRLESMDILAIIPVSNIASIRFYSAADATQKFGTTAANAPVIEVQQK